MASVEAEHQKRVLAVLADGRALSTVGIGLATGLGARASAEAATLLVLRGYAERSAAGAFSATNDGIAFQASGKPLRGGPIRKRGAMTVSRDTLRQRAWTAMRLHVRFTIDDLLMAAARPAEANPHGALQKYLSALCIAGFVVRLPGRAARPSPTSPGAVVYRLVKDTGERAPTIGRDGSVRDRNEALA